MTMNEKIKNYHCSAILFMTERLNYLSNYYYNLLSEQHNYDYNNNKLTLRI